MTTLGTPLLAGSLIDVLGVALGVVLCLTGLALTFMGVCTMVERLVARGLSAVVTGLLLLAGGLYLTGFLG